MGQVNEDIAWEKGDGWNVDEPAERHLFCCQFVLHHEKPFDVGRLVQHFFVLIVTNCFIANYIVCTPLPAWGGGGRVEPPSKFSKKGEGFIGSQFLHRGSQKNNIGNCPKQEASTVYIFKRGLSERGSGGGRDTPMFYFCSHSKLIQ